MNKKFVNTYVKYTAKKPLLFFAMILVGVLSITILALSTKTSLMLSANGVVNGYSIVFNGEADSSYTGFIYVYSDRNEGVYSVEVLKTIHEKEQTIFLLDDNNGYISTMNQQEIKIDIPIREMTIFERVFLKGGKVNE